MTDERALMVFNQAVADGDSFAVALERIFNRASDNHAIAFDYGDFKSMEHHYQRMSVAMSAMCDYGRELARRAGE